MTYDPTGNLGTITVQTAGGPQVTQFTWDQRNRLGTLAGPSLTASFVYDGLGRRTSRTVNARSLPYLYDGVDILREGTGLLAVPYLRSLAVDEPFSRGTTEFYLTDALGSTVALTNAAGTLRTTYSYEPFGRTQASGPASTNPFQFTGRENDGTGLYYYRARYYHPGLGRLVSEDPIEFDAGDVNLYVYVGNRPTDSADPLGLFGVEDLPAIPAPVVNAVAGFGDAFLVPELVRWALDIDDVVDRCTAEYRAGMVAGIVLGSVPFVFRGVAALGGTRVGHILNHNPYLRIGPGRMPGAGRGLPAGPDVPRLSLGSQGLHLDLRSRLPYVPPIGLAGRKSC